MWQGQIAPLNHAGFKLITWDMRGHGKSTYPESLDQYSEPATVADMAALLGEVSGRESQAVVGGLSLGGYMSLAFYRVHPQRVTILLIIDTGPGYKSDAARDEWNKSAIQIGAKFDQEGLEQLKRSTPERAQVAHRNAKGLALAARGMLAQRTAAVINSLPDIKVPALVVVGADDKPYLAASEYMAKKIPGAKNGGDCSSGPCCQHRPASGVQPGCHRRLERSKGCAGNGQSIAVTSTPMRPPSPSHMQSASRLLDERLVA